MIEVAVSDTFIDLEFGDGFYIESDPFDHLFIKIDSDLYVKDYHTCEYIRKSDMNIYPETKVEKVF